MIFSRAFFQVNLWNALFNFIHQIASEIRLYKLETSELRYYTVFVFAVLHHTNPSPMQKQEVIGLHKAR